jgi:MFS transporter, putative metabolite:H+ symporter
MPPNAAVSFDTTIPASSDTLTPASSDTTAAAAAGIAARLERLPLTAYQRRIFLVIATAWFFDSMDLGALTFVLGSIRGEFALTPAAAGVLSSMSFVGMFAGASTAGLLADRFGRRVVFQTSMIFWGAGGLLCGLAPDVQLLGLARILLGFGMGMEFPVAQSMVSELIPAKNRGRYLACLEGFWPLGFICSGLLSLTVLSVANWRWVFILEAIPAVFVLVVRRYVPESPRWLASRGDVAGAEQVMTMIENKVRARSGGAALPDPVAQAPIEDGRTGLAALWTGIYTKRTAMLWGLWFFALLGFYGLTTWLGALLQQKGFPVTKSVYYTILISLAGIPGFLTSAWLVEAWGRKSTCIATLLGSAAGCFFYGSATTQAELISFGLVMQFCLFGMWSVLYAYTPELYPTRVRATGSGFASAIGRLGSLLGPAIVGVVLPVAGTSGVFALGAGAFVVAAAVVLTLGEETKARTLEAISQ